MAVYNERLMCFQLEQIMPSLMTAFGIDRLPAEDQLRLVGEILNGLTDQSPPPITDAQRDELDRRIAAVDAGATTFSPWAEVEARILARLRQ